MVPYPGNWRKKINNGESYRTFSDAATEKLNAERKQYYASKRWPLPDEFDLKAMHRTVQMAVFPNGKFTS
jgi:hypothetical protein